MMQKTRTPVDIHAQGNVPEGAVGLVPDVTPESLATVWVSRFTFLAGGLCLLMALSIWLWRPNHYRLVLPESDAVRGDILVCRGLGEDTPHSAILTEPVVQQGKGYLDASSTVQTKNGRLPETEMTMERLTGDEFLYGDSFQVFRRR